MEKQIEVCYRTPQKLDIEFENLWLTVREKWGYKKIVKGVTGKFKSGELTAIMGPSGAGKTSLLNVLTGFHKSGVEGVIKCLNGRKSKKGTSQYRKDSCYILQDDHLPEVFTVNELMYSTAQLKIAGISKEQMHFLIDEILTTLGLYRHKQTPCGNLSGGQKKRMSIALELIDNPPIMFLDEPTTGLDSNTSNQCVQMLKSLAEKGRTIICTIHQPSSPLYMSFDHVFVMANGKCVYQGAPENTVSFLTNQGHVCPQYHNPADFLLEVTNGEYGDCTDKLALAAKENNWRININTLSIEDDKKSDIISTNDKFYDCDNSSSLMLTPPSEWKRFGVLFKKQLIYLYRDWTVSRLKLALHFLVGIFLGLTFQNAGNDASRTVTNTALFMVGCVYLSYTSLMPAVLRFPSELAIIRKEHFNRWYKLSTYYASFSAADIPMQILFSFAYMMGSYTISAQPFELYRFLQVLLVMSMVALIACGIGLMYGTLVNPVNGTFLGAIFTCLQLSVGGFLCLFPDMNKVLYFFSNFTYYSFAMEALLQSVYLDRPNLDCPEEREYCMHTRPNEILRDLGMDKLTFWIDIGVLSLNFVFFRGFAYFALKYAIKKSS